MKQKEASDKVNKHINNLYSAKIYNVSSVHLAQSPARCKYVRTSPIYAFCLWPWLCPPWQHRNTLYTSGFVDDDIFT